MNVWFVVLIDFLVNSKYSQVIIQRLNRIVVPSTKCKYIIFCSWNETLLKLTVFWPKLFWSIIFSDFFPGIDCFHNFSKNKVFVHYIKFRINFYNHNLRRRLNPIINMSSSCNTIYESIETANINWLWCNTNTMAYVIKYINSF